MKRLLSVFAAVSVSTAALVAVSAAPAFAAVIYCNGFMTGNIPGHVIVRSGDTCTLEEANVAGNVNVRPGGALEVLGSQLTGSNITANAPAGLYIDRSTIGANVTIKRLMPSEGQFPSGICASTIGGDLTFSNSNPETTFTIGTGGDGAGPAFEDGEGGCSAPNNIHGSVLLNNNQGGFELLGNQVGANVVASSNNGGGEISGNTIMGSLICASNSPPLFVSGNSVVGHDRC
jgi:hypothetical protein